MSGVGGSALQPFIRWLVTLGSWVPGIAFLEPSGNAACGFLREKLSVKTVFQVPRVNFVSHSVP